MWKVKSPILKLCAIRDINNSKYCKISILKCLCIESITNVFSYLFIWAGYLYSVTVKNFKLERYGKLWKDFYLLNFTGYVVKRWVSLNSWLWFYFLAFLEYRNVYLNSAWRKKIKLVSLSDIRIVLSIKLYFKIWRIN